MDGVKGAKQINGLIFKELIKRGYSLDGKTRIWDIADSKLWYLTPEQAQGYLDLIATDAYKKRFNEREEKLIFDNMKELVDRVGNEPVNIVDLGCGDGLKAIPLIKALRKKTKVRYCPVDISSYMVNRALKNIRETETANEVVEFKWNISDFDNIENISSLLREGEYKKNFFLLLGGTLGNFDFHDLIYHIMESMKQGDSVLIGNYLESDTERGMTELKIPKKQSEFFDHILLNLGFEHDEFEAARRIRNHRSENYYTIKKDHKVEFKGRVIEFYAGDQIITGVSYYYPYGTFIDYLKLYFSDTFVKVDPEKSYLIALCKK